MADRVGGVPQASGWGRFSLVFAATLLLAASAQAAEGVEAGGPRERLLANLSVNGYLRNETAFRLNTPAALVKVMNIVNLEPRYTFGPRAQLTARLRGFYDAAYDLVDIDTLSPRKGPESVLTGTLTPEQVAQTNIHNLRDVEIRRDGVELREFYLDLHFRILDIRAGRQIVRWGVVEGARVTDEINPLDFQEFILREINDRYIPLWLVKNDLYLGDTTVEALWIPDLRTHEPAAKESEWEQFRFLPGMIRPAMTVRNSEWAVRVSRLFGGWDLSASYFSTWDDFPVAFRNLEDLNRFGVSPALTFVPRVGRLEIVGATLSKSLGRVILNAEAAWVEGKLFGTKLGKIGDQAVLVGFGEVQKNYFKYALQVDFSIFSTDLSLQVLQHRIADWEPTMIQDEIDTVYGFFGRKELLHNRMVAQALVLFFQNNHEWLIRPRMEYALTERVKLSVGSDVLLGNISDAKPGDEPTPGQFHFVGFFKNHSRVYTELQYSF
ncbi:MAG: hypothetical protein HY207_06870 [Nitrospirae bacterium]|nr:hypothetical protein [Nitrospirota bacterium]